MSQLDSLERAKRTLRERRAKAALLAMPKLPPRRGFKPIPEQVAAAIALGGKFKSPIMG